VIVLAIESAAETCSAALWDCARPADGLVALRVLEPARGQAERLIGLVEAVLAEAGLGYRDLGALAVGHGPGSFTGLRTAVAAARGLALATGLGVIPVSSLETLAGGAAPCGAGDVFAVLDARRGEVYAQGFAPDLSPLPGAAGEPRATPPQDLARAIASRAPVRLVGSGASLVEALLPRQAVLVQGAVRCDASLVASCAARRLAAGEAPVPGFAVHPLYLRAPDAHPPRPFFTAPCGADERAA